MRQILGSRLLKFTQAEKQLLRNQIDFIGINHYKTLYVKDCIFSPCDMDTYNGDALVFELAERNGIPIGKPVKYDTVLCTEKFPFKCSLQNLMLLNKILQTPVANNYVVPSSMEKLVMHLKQRYNNTPMYISENGQFDKIHILATCLSIYSMVAVCQQYHTNIWNGPLVLTGYAQIGNSTTATEELINDTDRISYIRDYLTYLGYAIRLLHFSVMF
jgi:beta-glucosidase